LGNGRPDWAIGRIGEREGSELQKKLDALRKEFSQLKREKERLANDQKDLKDKFNNVTRVKGKLEDELDGLKGKYAGKKQDLGKAMSELATEKGAGSSLREEIEKLKEDHARALKRLEDQVGDKESEIRTKDQNYDTLKRAEEIGRGELLRVQKEWDNLTAENNGLEAQITEMREGRDKALEERNAKEIENKQLRIDGSQLNLDFKAKELEAKQYEESLRETQRTNQTLTDDNGRLTRELASEKKRLDVLESKLRYSESETRQAKKAGDNLREQRRASATSARTLEHELNTLKNSDTDLQEQVDASARARDEAIAALEQELENLTVVEDERNNERRRREHAEALSEGLKLGLATWDKAFKELNATLKDITRRARYNEIDLE
jgi:chromosome segregation ATPase